MAQGGVNPVDVIFVAMSAGNSVNEEFPTYYKEKYKSDPDKLLKRALKKEYLIEGYNYENSAQKMKVNELKEILRQAGQRVSGTKSQLINRILSEIPAETIKSIFTDKEYIITAKGEKFIENNEFALIFHKNNNIANYISLDNFYDLCVHTSNFTPGKVLENYLIEEARQYTTTRDWANYRKILLIQHDITDSISYKCLICFVDINFLKSLVPKYLPNKDEIKEFRELFAFSVKPLSYQSPIYSIEETLGIVMEGVEQGKDFSVSKILEEINISESESKAKKADEETKSNIIMPVKDQPASNKQRQYDPLVIEGKFSRGVSFYHKILFIALTVIFLIVLFNKLSLGMDNVSAG